MSQFQILLNDATSGDVDGPVPAVSTDKAIVRWNGTGGRDIQNSTAILGDTGNLSGIGSLSAAGSVTISRSVTSPNIINLTNTSNTSGADAQIELVVAGTSGGDCKINLSVTGVPGVQWHFGLDNSDDDAFIIGQGSTFGGDTEIRIDNAGIFQMQKGVSHNLTTTATDYSILVTDYFIGVTDNSAARTITLPSTSAVGQTYTVKDQAGTSGATPIIIATAGAELIDGAATATINVNYGALRFYFDGTNYFIM